jgi:hypothetical protein
LSAEAKWFRVGGVTRTAAIAAAIALGVLGVVLGAIALARSGGDSGSAFTRKTLVLHGGKGPRIEYEAPILVKGNPAGVKAWETNHPITGDATGQVTVVCVPLITKDVDCVGGFQLSDGDINVENIEEATADQTRAEGSILGGSGAYSGAFGSWTVDWGTHTYTLHLLLPKT